MLAAVGFLSSGLSAQGASKRGPAADSTTLAKTKSKDSKLQALPSDDVGPPLPGLPSDDVEDPFSKKPATTTSSGSRTVLPDTTKGSTPSEGGFKAADTKEVEESVKEDVVSSNLQVRSRNGRFHR